MRYKSVQARMCKMKVCNLRDWTGRAHRSDGGGPELLHLQERFPVWVFVAADIGYWKTVKWN